MKPLARNCQSAVKIHLNACIYLFITCRQSLRTGNGRRFQTERDADVLVRSNFHSRLWRQEEAEVR